MITLTLNLDNFKQVLDALLLKLARPAPVMTEVGKVMLAGIEAAFELEGRVQPWHTEREIQDRPILTRTGTLRESFYQNVSGYQTLVGTDVPYAEFVNRRFPFMVVLPDDTNQMEQCWRDYLNELLL